MPSQPERAGSRIANLAEARGRVAHQQAPQTHALASIEAELLGAVLKAPDLYDSVSWLLPVDFGTPEHAELWAAISSLVTQGHPIGLLALTLHTNGDFRPMGGAAYVERITANAYPDPDLAAQLAAKIADLARRRRLLAATRRASAQLDDLGTDTQTIAFDLEQACLDGSLRRRHPFVTGRAAATALAAAGPAAIVPTGIRGLDHILGGGFHLGRLYAVAGRQKSGKTVLTATLGYNLANGAPPAPEPEPIPHLIYSLERSTLQLEQLACARAIGVNAMELLDPSPAVRSAMEAYAARTSDAALYEHNPSATIDDIRHAVHVAVRTRGVKGWFVDYWQLIQGRKQGDTEEQHLRYAAQTLAALAARTNTFGVITAKANAEGRIAHGEGLDSAASAVLVIQGDPRQDNVWLNMTATNYTRYRSLGSPSQPGLLFDQQAGPHFADPTTSRSSYPPTIDQAQDL